MEINKHLVRYHVAHSLGYRRVQAGSEEQALRIVRKEMEAQWGGPLPQLKLEVCFEREQHEQAMVQACDSGILTEHEQSWVEDVLTGQVGELLD